MPVCAYRILNAMRKKKIAFTLKKNKLRREGMHNNNSLGVRKHDDTET